MNTNPSSADRSPPTKPKRFHALLTSLVQWFDADYTVGGAEAARQQPDRIEFVRCLPFAFLHLGCLGVFLVGWSWTAVAVALALYIVRMFAVTGIYHRYFSHKTYRTSRFGQFILAIWGATAVQRGPLWWAYHHRHHHQHSDDPEDVHSPHVHGFWWSHIGWITSKRNFPTDYSMVRDLAKYPELVFLNRFDLLVPALFALAVWGAGWLLETYVPSTGVTSWQLLIWGFFISTTALFHGTSCINSLAHLLGGRRFSTTDDSRNSFLLAIITLGEGWHNNHHRYMSSTRQGFYWWEIDITYYLLRMLSWTGFIHSLKEVPASIYAEADAQAHAHSVKTSASSSHGSEIASLRRVVPAAAAIALATVPATTTAPHKPSVSEVPPTGLNTTPPADNA